LPEATPALAATARRKTPATSPPPFKRRRRRSPHRSISISGAPGRTQDFGGGNEQDLQDRIQEFRERIQREGFGGGFGGQGGGMGGGPIAIGRIGGRGFNINQPHGVLYFADDNSSSTPLLFRSVDSHRQVAIQPVRIFGANVGGPLKFPKFSMAATNGFSLPAGTARAAKLPTMPFPPFPPPTSATAFLKRHLHNGSPVEIFNPATGQQYQFNGIPNAIDRPPSAPPRSPSSNLFRSLTSPLPHGQNFTTSPPTPGNSDAVIFRLFIISAPAPALWCLGRAGVEAVATAAVRTISISA